MTENEEPKKRAAKLLQPHVEAAVKCYPQEEEGIQVIGDWILLIHTNVLSEEETTDDTYFMITSSGSMASHVVRGLLYEGIAIANENNPESY